MSAVTISTPIDLPKTRGSSAHGAGHASPSATISREEHLRRVEELGRVILAYSDATEKLQQSHEELSGRVAALQAELGEKNRELERRNRLAALGEMAAGLAHEIRNPLGAIRLYAGLLKGDVSDRPASGETVDKISRAVARLETIVSGVLTFSRELRCNPDQGDLAATVRECVDVARTRFADRTFAVTGPESLPARFDDTLLGQALLNLIVNACEAVDAGGRVEVSFGAAAGRRFIRIRDTGPGIDAAILDRIFNPFFTTKDTGTGLGLSIVHRIIEAHDGTIRARNHEQGGAAFEVVL
jgi:signal transduction histidine kinase